MMKNKLFIVMALLIGFTTIYAQNKESAKPKEAKTEKVTYHIPNMHGDHCKQIIEKKIPFEKGVKDLVFDLKGQILTIVYQPQRTTPENLQSALEKMGYEVKLVGDSSALAQKKECNKGEKKECNKGEKKACSKSEKKECSEKKEVEKENRSCCRSK